MAREEQDREDLIREATALVERAELRLRDVDCTYVVGFRRGGAASIFIDQDFVLHFNTDLEIRRAYYEQQLLVADAGRWAALHRHRTASSVEFLRRSLTAAEAQQFNARASRELRRLANSLNSSRYEVVAQVPADADLISRITTWLAAVPTEPVVAQRPHVR